MGWFYDEHPGHYWRSKVDGGDILKVNIDRDTLGMYVGNGDFLQWNPNTTDVPSTDEW